MASRRRGYSEEALPKKLNFGVWKKIFSYALKHPFLIVIAFSCMLLCTFIDASFMPVLDAAAIKAAESTAFFDAVSIWEAPIHATFIFAIEVELNFTSFLITVIASILVRSLAVFVNFVCTNFISMKIMLDLRKDTFTKVQQLSFSYFDRNSSGWLIARMQSDTAALGDVIAWSFGMMLWSVFQFIFAIITMFSMNWNLSLLALCLVPIIVVVTPLLQKWMLRTHRTERAAQSYYVSHLSESIDGAKTVKTLSIEDIQMEQTIEISGDVKRKRIKAIRSNAYLSPILSLVQGCSIALIVAFANQRMIDGETAIDAALLVLFIRLVDQIFEPLQTIAEILSEFITSQASAEKVVQLLEAPIDIVDSEETIAKYGTIFKPKKENYPAFTGNIDFNDVSFFYKEDEEVLHDINLHIASGTSIALVGKTGSGKTTLANLICRFYELREGSILVDGVDIREYSLSALRSNIGYVQQTPFLFNKTFYENLTFGSEGASLETAMEAAKKVGIHDFIMSFEGGYDHYLSDGGASMSQGQKQLICIARALVRDPRILILDEATSSIDTVTEKKVQKAIETLLKGRTSIIIAHRLSTIVNADRILVMDNGSIVEDGKHEALLAKEGRYASLYRAQFEHLTIEEQISLLEKGN